MTVKELCIANLNFNLDGNIMVYDHETMDTIYRGSYWECPGEALARKIISFNISIDDEMIVAVK